jgi:hypothetical protein
LVALAHSSARESELNSRSCTGMINSTVLWGYDWINEMEISAVTHKRSIRISYTRIRTYTSVQQIHWIRL